MDNEKLLIKKKVKGEDGCKTLSIRLSQDMINEIEVIAAATNRSRNDVIGRLLRYALDNCEIEGQNNN